MQALRRIDEVLEAEALRWINAQRERARAIVAAEAEPRCWYLARVAANCELAVVKKCAERGVMLYAPREKATIRSNWNRKIVREAPIFSGVVFVPEALADLHALKEIDDRVRSYVRFGERLAMVTPAIMADIRTLEATLVLPPGQRRYAIGQLVRVKGGPFDMWTGRVARLDSGTRLTILLRIMEREVPVALDEDRIEADSTEAKRASGSVTMSRRGR